MGKSWQETFVYTNKYTKEVKEVNAPNEPFARNWANLNWEWENTHTKILMSDGHERIVQNNYDAFGRYQGITVIVE